MCLERTLSRLQSHDSEKYQYIAVAVPSAIVRERTRRSITCMAGSAG